MRFLIMDIVRNFARNQHNDLPDDTNREPAKYKAGFLSTTLKYCGVTRGLIGIEIGYLRVLTLFPH